MGRRCMRLHIGSLASRQILSLDMCVVLPVLVVVLHHFVQHLLLLKADSLIASVRQALLQGTHIQWLVNCVRLTAGISRHTLVR